MTSQAQTPNQATSPDEIHVQRVGTGSRRALGLHGLSGSGAFWVPLAERLGDEASFVLPDLIGFGSSPKPKIDYTAGAHFQAIRHLVEAPGEPWTLIGHSMGATIAVHIASTHPERVRNLVLFAAPIFSSAERREHLLGRQNLLTRLCLRYPAADKAVAAVFYGTAPLFRRIGPRLRKDLPAQVVLDYFRHTLDSYKSSAQNLMVGKDLMPDLARVPHPLMVIQGEHDSMVDDPSAISWPANVRLEVIPDSGHLWAVTHADEAARLVREFLHAL
ncbi:MAG: alpha/beta hydrolase [Dehalococcoidia bacterium]